MSSTPPADHDVTQLLEEWAAGAPGALDRLAPLVYPHLQQMAGSYFRRERQGHTWQPTVLVNELFLKLFSRRSPNFENRQHFYNACAKLMRLALIDHARASTAEKRGSGQDFVPLHEEMAWFNAAGAEMLDFDQALRELEALDAQQARIFETRIFLGATAEETAELLNVSKATVDRKMRTARAWLFQRLSPAGAYDTNSPPAAPSSL
ncbi:MAG: ECF-type sigma factor [Bryobacter sp.]|nr:ECF-type sigma factor [Bryobacter sp.]